MNNEYAEVMERSKAIWEKYGLIASRMHVN